MYRRLLDFLRCPGCGSALRLAPLWPAEPAPGEDISEGLLRCLEDHWFPVVRGVPRMLPDALREHWGAIEGLLAAPEHERLRADVEASQTRVGGDFRYDRRTLENFSLEWQLHSLGDRTWGMDVDDRVDWFFTRPIRIPPESLQGKVLLDAGCGNGSQSVVYTELGLEVIALDLSSGLELGRAYRHARPKARPDRVHFVQGDLQSPPIAPASVDIIHSAGVLQATPHTETTFKALSPLLKAGGTFYVWVLKYEPVVTPVVNALRVLTTRVAPGRFARIAQAMAPSFQLFCRIANRIGLRSYNRMSRREAALALMDIFGSPYAHYHSFDDVAEWYRAEGFTEIWGCNDDRRGFGICGRRALVERPASWPDGQRPEIGRAHV
jgi:ubiquinone/menaquinone biosynthesis C-methylase UbiE/uncharacterized protein YbaR (Trm112 family)